MQIDLRQRLVGLNFETWCSFYSLSRVIGRKYNATLRRNDYGSKCQIQNDVYKYIAVSIESNKLKHQLNYS